MAGLKSNHPELPDSSHSEDRLGGLFSYMPTTESITTPHIHTRAVSQHLINFNYGTLRRG